MPKIRNIIIFVVIGAVIVLVYIFFIKPALSSQPDLVSATDTTTSSTSGSGTDVTSSDGSAVAQDFLTLLLSVKNIKLNVSIFSDPAFASLHDSSVTLTPDATIGRPDPFAQFGVGDTVTAVPAATTTAPAANTPTTPPITTPTNTPTSTGH